jgi:hypothetical protein
MLTGVARKLIADSRKLILECCTFTGAKNILLPAGWAEGKGKTLTTSSKTMGEVYRQQGQALIEQLILFAHDLLEQDTSVAEVFSRSFAKQQKEILV